MCALLDVSACVGPETVIPSLDGILLVSTVRSGSELDRSSSKAPFLSRAVERSCDDYVSELRL